MNLIVASICDKNSVGPSIRPICTRCCFAMTNMIQVRSNFHWAWAVGGDGVGIAVGGAVDPDE